MSLKSWWKRATTIPDSPRGIIGNLAKNVSPFLALTGVGALGAGALATAGEKIRNPHASFGDLAKAGITNAGIGKGLKSGVGLLRGASSAPAAPGVALPSTPGVVEPAVGALTPLEGGNIAGAQSALSKGGGALRSAASFAAKNPNATGMALQGIGNLSTAGAENRLQNAQARALERQIGESEYEFAQRRARDLALEPLRQALAQQIGTTIGTPQRAPAANPYSMGA